MTLELIVPTLGESISEATVSKWLKKVGENIEIDEPVVEIETDKITVEVPSPKSGVLSKIKVQEGEDVKVGGILAIINESRKNKDLKDSKPQTESIQKVNSENSKVSEEDNNLDIQGNQKNSLVDNSKTKEKFSPSVKKLIEENNLNAEEINTTRDDNRITKADVLKHIEDSSNIKKSSNKKEEVVPISKIRQTIAKRLKEAQNTAAILSTFNEVDMSEVIKVRELKKENFIKKYDVKLGFMSFFVKACVIALQEFSAVNAEIKDENIIYKNHYDIGIAVGTERGLVVPVLKDADEMSFGDIEKNIVELTSKAREGRLTIEDLSGGTFTISNGGVYGSMLSTPIINRPQSGILGMHNIIKRPVVINDEIVIRSMMYLAFSYDHRIVDGKESVGFLIKIKELIENPSSLVLGI